MFCSCFIVSLLSLSIFFLNATRSVGYFGYFPTYSLGAIYAQQFYSQAHSAFPSLEHQISRGNFKPLVHWLTERIFSQGAYHVSADALCRFVCDGRELDTHGYVQYLQRKYSTLYHIDLLFFVIKVWATCLKRSQNELYQTGFAIYAGN